jgi:hypothetical protein
VPPLPQRRAARLQRRRAAPPTPAPVNPCADLSSSRRHRRSFYHLRSS